MTTVGVAIPSIPPRADLLERALDSVRRQTRPVDQIAVAHDTEHLGAAHTRNEAWRQLDTDWVGFLDDDDEFLPHHIERLLFWAELHQADMVYPWFTVVGGTDPFPEHFGLPWDPAAPRQTTITCLWRRSALETIGGFPAPGDAVDVAGNRVGEDYCAVLALNDTGGRIVHLPERTWLWYHHTANTSGLPERWAHAC